MQPYTFKQQDASKEHWLYSIICDLRLNQSIKLHQYNNHRRPNKSALLFEYVGDFCDLTCSFVHFLCWFQHPYETSNNSINSKQSIGLNISTYFLTVYAKVKQWFKDKFSAPDTQTETTSINGFQVSWKIFPKLFTQLTSTNESTDMMEDKQTQTNNKSAFTPGTKNIQIIM